MIVFAVASELELRGLRRQIELGRTEVLGGKPFYFGRMRGREVCLVTTGVGRKNASAAARKICSIVRPGLVVNAGAAGALDPGFKLGATVVVESVVRENNPEKIVCPEAEVSCAQALLRAAGMKAKAGCCCQVRTFIHRTVDKQVLFEKTGAHIVDMESAALGHEFQSAGVPFVNIRIVSDMAGSDTADMETLVRLRYKKGRLAAALYLLKHPRELVRVWSFYRAMGIADKRIAEAVGTLMGGMIENSSLQHQ